MPPASDTFHTAPGYQAILELLQLGARDLFTRSDVKVWRSITERENCTLDVELQGRSLRFHIKRYKPSAGGQPAETEAKAIRTLADHGIATVPLVAWGTLADGRSFLVTENLYGYRDAERMVREGLPFERLLRSTADLAAALHSGGLHHRDLYLCHFFAKEEDPSNIRLIDAGRVRRLPRWPMRRRWIVKDLAQFWFSTMDLATEAERSIWLARYAERRGLASTTRLRKSMERKSASIAKHDARLRAAQQDRNVSLYQ